jgi:DNA-binding transcriptional ArsR family regulator
MGKDSRSRRVRAAFVVRWKCEHVFVQPKAARGETRKRVAELLATGLSFSEVAVTLGVSKPTVSFHARRLGIAPSSKFSRRYDWSEIQRYYDAGHSITECQLHFGFARKTFWDACKRGDVTTRPQAMPIQALLSAPRNRTHLKRRLFAAGLKANRCECCGLTEWRGAPLSMALHHINGDGRDNRLENLQLLCPNCHSQTENFSGRGRRRLVVVG